MLENGKVSIDIDVTLKIDEETMAALIQEGVLMGDAEVDSTIRRRLVEGLATARIMGPRDITLRPIHKGAFQLPLKLDSLLVKDLDELADAFFRNRCRI